MAEVVSANSLSGSRLAARPTRADDAHFDVTPMVDLVFMMNIFFMVTWITAALAEIDLPTAQHCTAADMEASVIVTLINRSNAKGPLVYLGDPQTGQQLSGPAEGESRIREAAQAGMAEGKDPLLIKAEKRVRLRDVARIGAVAGMVEGMKLKLAVVEKE
jgi:biopolymer transport protein ExbD